MISKIIFWNLFTCNGTYMIDWVGGVVFKPSFKTCWGPSRREVKIDVWKYLQTIVMGLYAVCEQTIAHPDRVLSLRTMRMCSCWNCSASDVAVIINKNKNKNLDWDAQLGKVPPAQVR